MQKITPFLWFAHEAEEAATFYTTLFDNSAILNVSRSGGTQDAQVNQEAGKAFIVSFRLLGQPFTAMNGGPAFTLNQSISLTVSCDTKEQQQRLYEALSEGGKIFFPLTAYPWSPSYAWVEDKFGLSWQLEMARDASGQKITPTLLFANANAGRVKEAATLYTALFPNSSICFEAPHPPQSGLPEGSLLFCKLQLNGYSINAMSSTEHHDFAPNEAFSFVIDCESQEEVDTYWDALTTDGGQESRCGWLKDTFGISWQVVPRRLIELLTHPDRSIAQKAQAAMLGMKKIVIAELEQAIQ